MKSISWLSAMLVGAGALAGCSETTSETTSTNPTFMSPAQMQDFCRGEAAGKFQTRPASVDVSTPQPGVGGGYIVTGSVDQGENGSAPFECRFGDAGNFVTLTEL